MNICNKETISVGVDFDETLVDTAERFCQIYNFYTKERLSVHDLIYYDTSTCVPDKFINFSKSIWGNKDIYNNINPITDSQRYMKILSMASNVRLYIVTDFEKNVIGKKIETINRLFPWVHPENVIICHNKQLLNFDVLIDDNPDNLVEGMYNKILMDAPWNKTFIEKSIGAKRCNSWEEIYTYLTTLFQIY